MKTATLWVVAAIVPFGFVVLALAAAGGFLATRKAAVHVPARARN